MEWYFIVLILVFCWAFLTISIYALVEDGIKEYLKHLHLVLIFSLILAVLSPFIVVFSLALALKVFTEKKPAKGSIQIKNFDIPKVDEEIKTTLLTLGFEEGTFNSLYINRRFSGFRWHGIEITYDGKAMAFNEITKETERLISLLKNLKSKEKRQGEIKANLEWANKNLDIAKKEKREMEKKLAKLDDKHV